MPVKAKAAGQHHHGALRRALLDAVAEIVLEAGPEAVTLRECARRAGVSHSAVTPHFGDKRGLLTAFARESFERLRAAMEAETAALPDDATPQARLAATGRGYIAFARTNPGHFRLMFRADLLNPADPELCAAEHAAFVPLAQAMAAVAPGAEARAMRARLALAWSAVHGFSALRAEIPDSPLWNAEAQAQEVADDLLALVAAACSG